MNKNKNISNINQVYFVGIGGIGMSAIARYFNENGKKVGGYDRFQSALCKQLEKEGISINYEDNIDLLNQNADLVVYTPAIPKHHKQLNFYLNNGYTVKKRSQVLGDITHDKFTIAVAGSHGKTSVSSMIAHLLSETGYGCTAFLGGIAKNFNSNYTNAYNFPPAQRGELGGELSLTQQQQVVVVEADEFDRSFLTLHPNLAVITSIDTDHLDIYGNFENIKAEFQAFANQIDKNGLLLHHTSVKLESNGFKTKPYSLNTVSNHQVNTGTQTFQYKGTTYQLNIGGTHNAENMLAAINIALQLGLTPEQLKPAVANFTGIKRRFDKQFENENLVYIDDYAHHPNEIKALLNSVKAMYNNWKITAIFQPHLFSRTKDLATDFGQQLSLADEVILLPIYPARELPIEGVTSELILNQIIHQNKSTLNANQVLQKVNTIKQGVILTIGAGSINQLVNPIKEIVSEK